MSNFTLPNRVRVSISIDILRDGLRPFVETRLKRTFGSRWSEHLRLEYDFTDGFEDASSIEPDVYILLKACVRNWEQVFAPELGKWGRTLVSELQIWRNRWAHQCSFTDEDADRMLESTARLLAMVGASDAEVRELRRPALVVRHSAGYSHPGVASRPGGQRAFMQDLVVQLGFDRDVVTLAYAAAEERGEVHRKNKNQPALSYARALWSDGVKKGWLRSHGS